jgi:hypothetical protein
MLTYETVATSCGPGNKLHVTGCGHNRYRHSTPIVSGLHVEQTLLQRLEDAPTNSASSSCGCGSIFPTIHLSALTNVNYIVSQCVHPVSLFIFFDVDGSPASLCVCGSPHNIPRRQFRHGVGCFPGLLLWPSNPMPCGQGGSYGLERSQFEAPCLLCG